jgi:heptosyltransferase-1
LIVRVSSLGDVVHNMPMVADIRRAFPEATIDWVVEEAYTSLLRLNRGVSAVIPVALRRWRKSLWSAATRAETWAEMRTFHRHLQAQAYDFVFDTQGLFKTSAIMRLARLNKGGKRIGLANATEDSGYESISRIFHDLSVPVGLHTHAVLRARTVAAKALAYVADGTPDFDLRPPSLDAPETAATPAHASADTPAWMPAAPYAVFFHATARAEKQWPVAHWQQIARGVNARGLPILLPWGSDSEKRAAQQLAAGMPQAIVLPKLSLMEAVMLAQRAALVIGVDTGLTHIAAAYNRPTIELYSDSPRWKTQGDWSSNIINLGDVGAPPEVAAVEVAVQQLLG